MDALQELLNKHQIKNPKGWCDLPVGWVKLVDELFTKMIAEGWDRDLHQIKEKFGSLRVYPGDAKDEIYSLIDHYESLSRKTCMSCGTQVESGTGIARKGYDVMCGKCEENYGN